MFVLYFTLVLLEKWFIRELGHIFEGGHMRTVTGPAGMEGKKPPQVLKGGEVF